MSDIQKVKCDGCRKQLMVIRFSETAIQKYKDSVVRNQRNPRTPIKYPRCFNCNPRNRQEMKCTKCDLTKSLDKFSKRQRQQTDTAECLDCVQEREDRLPNHEDAVEEIQIMEEYQSRIGHGSHYHSSSASRLTSANTSRVSGSQNGSDRYETETNPGNGSWIQGNDAVSLSGSNYTTGTIESRRPQTGTAWDSFESDGRVRGPPSQASRERFVKTNAVPKAMNQRIEEQQERERNRQTHESENAMLRSADDDEGSDDDDEPPF